MSAALSQPQAGARLDPAPTGGFSARVLDRAQADSALMADWQVLFDAVEGAPWSSQPAVYQTWKQTLRPDDRSRVIAVRDASGALRGVMPVMLDKAWRGPALAPRFDYYPRDAGLICQRPHRPLRLRQLAPMASLPATMLWIAPLCQPQDAAPVSEAIAGAICAVPGWSVAIIPTFEGPQVGLWQAAFTRAGAATHVQPLGRAVQNLHQIAPFSVLVSRQKGKFRQNVRRAQAAAQAAGIRFTFHHGAVAAAEVMPTVARLARASWKQEGRAGTEVHIAYPGDQQTFFEHLFALETPGCTPVVGIASDAQGALAVLMMLRHGRSVTALLTFWDGRLPKASPGLLLMGACIDWAVAQGARRFDMNATAPWVRYLVDGEDAVCNLVICAPTWRGRALARFSAIARRLR